MRMEAVREKHRHKKQKKKQESVKDEETALLHQSEDEIEITISVAEVENSIKDFTLLDDKIENHDLGQLYIQSTCSSSSRPVQYEKDREETSLIHEDAEIKVDEGITEIENAIRDQVITSSIESNQNELKEENDISVGYDIMTDYPSSSEEAVVLNSSVNKLDDCFDQTTNEKNSSAELKIVEEEPSAPCNSAGVHNYEYVPSVCYPDILSQIPYEVNMKENHEKLKPFTEVEMSSLYYNAELRNHDLFVSNFIEIELKSNSVVNHSLYQLLIDYLNCRYNLLKNKLHFGTLMEDCKQYQEQIWTLDTSSFTEYGECQDGNPVSATHNFMVAHFNSYIYEKFSRCVRDLESLATESYILNIFNEMLYRLKIQHYIDSICNAFSFLSFHSQIQLFSESEPRGPYGTDLRSLIIELKDSISVLFRFQRHPLRDEQFVTETRQWLLKLVSVLLRIATPNDHLFLLHHILRCPAGVGKWASHFIQPPLPCRDTMNQFYVDHLITTLAAILLPVESREMFLQHMETGQEDNSVWVIVDSDGEDGEDNNIPRTALKENDLIAFLNQIPLSDLFRQILLVSRRNEEDVYDVNTVTDHDVLRSIAISTLLVNLFEKSIANYNGPVYKQFCKLLSRLIQHTACYVSEHWQMFREAYIQRSIVDSDMLSRLQVEYDEFFLRVVNTLYTTHERIGWQYLATLPFGMITSHTLWRLYQYLFHVNSESGLLMSEEFTDTLMQLPDNDVYYFLTTLSNMALNRKDYDSVFIQSVVLQLFKIGFVDSAVRDKCMKPSRILIANLTSKYPSLISDLLLALKKDFVLVGKFALYLFKELPVSLWKLNTVDTQTISTWLLSASLTSWENNLARYILSQLNWSTDMTESDLFLPRDFHCHIAIIIVKSVYTFAEETAPTGRAAIISEGVRQVSSMVRSQSPEEALNNWAWQMLSKLKLHLLDQPACVVRMSLTDYRIVAQIPDINVDTESMCVLSDGISRNQSVAFYVALLMSNIGHNMPLICEYAWDYCDRLLQTYRYSQVLHILQLILPYFLDSIDSLIKQEKFVKVISKVILADQTYMKMAKNLIVTDFPGTILKQFASLIQYHIDNFSRYCLQSPYQIIEMWMRILYSVWNDSCRSVAYLMDKIFCTSLCDDTSKQMIMKILSELIKNVSSMYRATTSGGLTSLVSWINYGSNADITSVPVSLLPRNSTVVTESPYFAYFALQLEETFTQRETQLWSEVLKLLAATPGKANIDAAVKKACSALKLNPIPSGWLAIYRWSLYAIELPCDHPILPLFWQNFFRLYLDRVAGNTTTVCVGSKFFEGSVNYNYFKKIKRKLQECLTHYTSNTFVSDFEKPFCNNIITLYKSFALWLEEPRLQEPELFLPALSAAFNVSKLAEITNGDETMWIEYVDFDKIKVKQKQLNDEWNKALFRDIHFASNRAVCFVEDANIVGNMIDRLKMYDKKLPLPELVISPSIVPVISRDKFLNKSQMLDVLVEHFRVLKHFTKSYETEKGEQNNAVKSLLDAYPLLYSETDMEIKLYAACDTAASSTNKRRTASSIHCAGPALITLHVREGRLNKSVKHATEKSKIDFQMLLEQTLKEPPMQVCITCIVIELAVETLSKEIIEVNQAADLTILNLLHEVGVALFYKFVSVYDTEVSSYFPTKILLKRMIDKLGLTCIDKIESECSKLLKTILVSNHPKISSILVPHLTPSAVPATAFVRLYGKVTRVISPKNVEFVLGVIEKFCVKNWLFDKSPKLVDRSHLIEIVATSLKEMGSQPSESLIPVHKVLRNDMCEILKYDFPEHYGEILFTVLKGSADEKFSCDVWYDVLNTLLACTWKNATSGLNANNALRPGMTLFQVRDVARKYAFELTSLSLQELMETCNLLGASFMKERLHYGLYGLYPKYRIYIEPIIALHCMVGHAVIASVLYSYRTALADQICETVWPILLNLYSPWLVPYFTGSLPEPPEAWIQQLTDDRSVLLPWTNLESDMVWAFKMVGSFVECLKFIVDTLPATSVILSNVMQLYITQFAHATVKEHILTVLQGNLIGLKWSRYIPTLSDMELMLKVVDQYLPMCHSFLGSVFVEIPWKSVMEKDEVQNATKAHVILLNLLIKLANEPHLRQTGNVSALLQTAQQFHWHLVDATNYEHVLNWFVMSYDSRVLLLVTDEDCTGIDMAAFELLRIVAGFTQENSNQHPTTSKKRQMFVKACVKLSLQLANRYKTVFAGHQHQMELALTRMLDQMESAISCNVTAENSVLECTLLLSELLVLLNQPNGSMLPKIMIQVLSTWLAHRSAASCVMQALLKIVRSSVSDAVHLGVVLEASLMAWFKNSDGMELCDWNKVLDMIHESSRSHLPVEDTLVTNNHVLSLYALSVKQLLRDENIFIYSKVIQCITTLKPTVDNESKLPLLWSLAFKYGNRNWTEVMTSLLKLCTYLQQITSMKPGWGLFSVIGMQKQHVPTLRCKLLGHTLNAFIMVKMSEENSGKADVELARNAESDKRSPLLAGAESVKSLSTLENLISDKHFSEYKITLETAIRLIKSQSVTLRGGEQFIITLAKQLYTEGHVQAFQM